jgi:hypothetical protein
MKNSGPAVKAVLALFLTLGLMVGPAESAFAAPIADFSFTPKAPAVDQSVTFTFTGTCDLPPCRIQWRWFTADGNRLGTTMGEGPVLTYAFPRPDVYSVVAKITNASRLPDSASVTRTVAVTSTFQDVHRSVDYSSWRGVAATPPARGGYHVGSGHPAIASMSFAGTQVSYVAATGPDRGVALVSVDGVPDQRVDLYSATAGRRVVTVTDQIPASHTVTVQSTGGKNPASTGTAISLDEFVVGTEHIDDVDTRVGYDGWTGIQNLNAGSGSYRVNSTAGATTVLTFVGHSVTWITGTGPNQGQASISVDGRAGTIVDNYSAVRGWKVLHTFGGLAAGLHTVTVTVLGTRSASSTGNAVISDAFLVR